MVSYKNMFVVFLLLVSNYVLATRQKRWNKYKKIKGAIITLGLSLIYIIVNGMISTHKCNDELSSESDCLIGIHKRFVGFFDEGCLDVWHISHVLLWINIGLLYPRHYTFIFMISILWETFEHFFFKYQCGKTPVFCGRLEDILLNMLGYYIGNKIENAYNDLPDDEILK